MPHLSREVPASGWPWGDPIQGRPLSPTLPGSGSVKPIDKSYCQQDAREAPGLRLLSQPQREELSDKGIIQGEGEKWGTVSVFWCLTSAFIALPLVFSGHCVFPCLCLLSFLPPCFSVCESLLSSVSLPCEIERSRVGARMSVFQSQLCPFLALILGESLPL